MASPTDPRTAPLPPAHQGGGAQDPVDGAWAAAPQHYGDPSGEQWALEGGRALVARPDLAVVDVSGEDRQTWLTSLSTQVVTGMVPGDSRELLVLSPEGRIEHWAGASDDGTTTHLIAEGTDAGALAGFLDSMRFALRVRVSVRDDLAVYASVRAGGNDAAAVGALPGVEWTWEDPWPGVAPGGAAYYQGARHPGSRTPMMFHVVPRAMAGAFEGAWLEADGHRMAGMLAWEAMRVAAWRPRLGADTDARSIPPEVDWLRTAVHTDKGCYRGQETIARVVNLGRPPRRLAYLQLDGSRSELPEPGTRIEVGGRTVGVVTSVARHADEGPVALALLARTVGSEQVFDVNGVAAAQEVIIPVDGKCSASPASRPGAELGGRQIRRSDGGSGALRGMGSTLGSR